MTQQKVGQAGEMIAAAYLEAEGYHIVARNYRSARGEIDLIAKYEEKLIFIEVKTRQSRKHGFPEEAVSKQKEQMIIQTAEAYIEETDWQQDIRFDILSIELEPPHTIAHFEDAFAG